MKIKIIPFGPQPLPNRAHFNDAGADCYAAEEYILKPHETKALPLGFGLELPDGMVGFVCPRSGLSRRGISCELAPVDSGYRGEIHAIVTNHTEEEYRIKRHDRIGQIVILPCVVADFTTENYEQRGTGAFGSTGA